MQQGALALLGQAARRSWNAQRLGGGSNALWHSLQLQQPYATKKDDHHHAPAPAHQGDHHAADHHHDDHHHEPVPYGYHGAPGIVEYGVAKAQTSESARLLRTFAASTGGCILGGALGTFFVGPSTGMALACAGSLAVSGLWGKALPGRYTEFWIDPRLQWAMAAFGPLGVAMFGIYGVPGAIGGAIGGSVAGAVVGYFGEKDTDPWFPEHERRR